MSQISTPILNQAFELIREQIGVILTTEFEEQKTQLNQQDDIAVKILERTTVWSERFVPMQESEEFIVIPLFFSGNYSNQSAQRVQGDYQYYIDCYGRAKADKKLKTRADINSARRLQRLVGIIRNILSHPSYLTLGFPANPQIVRSSHVTSIKRTEVERQDDAVSTLMYRIILTVSACETTDNLPSVPLAGSDTTVLINETTLGYQYTVEPS